MYTRVIIRILDIVDKSPAPMVKSISSSVQTRGEIDALGSAAAAAEDEVSQMVAGAVTAGLCIEEDAVARLGTEEAKGGGNTRMLMTKAI